MKPNSQTFHLHLKSLFYSFFNPLKPNTMKQLRIVAATLLLLAGISMESFAQSPTIQKEVRLVNPTTGGSGYVGLKAAAGTVTYTLTLPGTIPTVNQILKIDAVTGSTATATWSDASSLVTSSAWSLTGNGSTNPTTNYLGTSDAQGLSIRTAATERISIAAGGAINLTGATTLASTLGVTGATTLSSTLNVVGNTTLGGTLTVTGATDLTGLLTANGGATINGATNITGATGINTSGTATTTIGNSSANTAVVINSGATGRLTLGGIQAGAATNEILVLDGSDRVGKISMSTLNNGLYRTRGTEAVAGLESKEITGITGLATSDVINITLEGTGADMPIPSYYVVRDTGSTKFTVYFSAAFTGTFNYAVIKN
jgi:hypothetical protein